MKRDFKSISSKTYDVIVIGGGIVGAGIARDLTFRGLDTLLLEKEDFGSGTTSRSTRLVHGSPRSTSVFLDSHTHHIPQCGNGARRYSLRYIIL